MTQQIHCLLLLSFYLAILIEILKIVRASMEYIQKNNQSIIIVQKINQFNDKQFQSIYYFLNMNQQIQKDTQPEQILQDISGLSLSLGICKSLFQNNHLIISHMPISLYPYLMKATVFDKLKNAHLVWQKLFIKIAYDIDFVVQIAQLFCKNDSYMSRILDIYKNHDLKNKCLARVACARVDYMGDDQPLLVEYNLMSVGLNGMSDRVQNLHKILNKYNHPQGKYTYPENRNQQIICKALLKALQQSKLTEGLIVMVVHQKQFNYGDHFAFKLEMIKRGRRVQSITMCKLIQKMKFDEETLVASIDGKNIDAFYFRTGYSPHHFATEKHWQIRQKIQMSRSIKLPSVDMILINSKRFQSQLSKKNILTKFLSVQQADLLASISGQIYDFDDKTDLEIEQLIQKTAVSDYVLKPNKQGGGNNFFSEKAHSKLVQLYKQKTYLQNYILMKKIKVKPYKNYFIFQHKPEFINRATCQFSTLGSFVYRKDKIIMNQMGGTLIRLKKQQTNEGGIAINQGVLSSLCIQNFTQD